MAAGDLDWWIAFRSPGEIWKHHPSFLVAEIIYYFLGLLTIIHAFRHGGRYIYLWFSIMLHGLVVESLSYFMPDIDNFWHAQSMVMLLGKRLPLHIMFVYAVFIYPASVAVSRMHLKWGLPFAVGVSVVLIDIPFDIMGIKSLWWTWHDTDPNVFDRMYWVPWTSYYFHASFASSFTMLFYGTRRLVSDVKGFQSDSFVKELVCSLVTGMFAMPLGTLQFIPVYHLLHDTFNIHTEVCLFLFLGVYLMIIWADDRRATKESRSQYKGWFDEIALLILIHFTLYMAMVFYGQPQNNRSIGLHEPIGDCVATLPVQTASGKILSKKAFLCASNYSEAYYDFHCLPRQKLPPDGSSWYTICGTAFPSPLEYQIVVCAFCLLGLFAYLQMLAYSGREEKVKAMSRTKTD